MRSGESYYLGLRATGRQLAETAGKHEMACEIAIARGLVVAPTRFANLQMATGAPASLAMFVVGPAGVAALFTRVAAAEWGPYGIRINCVAPGLVLGEAVMEHLIASGIDIEESSKAFPLQRAGRPEDLANAIVFLASDAAAYISGETLAVCGGPVLGGGKNS